MAHLDSPPRNIPEATLCRIGAIAVLWGAIDHYMDQLIWQLSGLNFEAGREITITMRTSAKRVCLKTLMNGKGKASGAARKVVNDALDIVRDTADNRDLLMHAFWFANKKTGVPEASSFKLRGDKPTGWRAKTFSDRRLDKMVLSLQGAHDILGRFAEARDLWQRSLREIHEALLHAGPYIPP